MLHRGSHSTRGTVVPLIAWVAATYAAGLIAGLSADAMSSAAGLGALAALGALVGLSLRRATAAALLLIAALGIGLGANAARADRECMARERLPFKCRVVYEPPPLLAPMRDRA
ncbi:MAG: hypothetical protein NTW72_06025, partial [Gemmatimonadetes bacterium]|nr:hypothetical protein [Gemmatimonadota bacterium]